MAGGFAHRRQYIGFPAPWESPGGAVNMLFSRGGS
jgi:hypothetical protein